MKTVRMRRYTYRPWGKPGSGIMPARDLKEVEVRETRDLGYRREGGVVQRYCDAECPRCGKIFLNVMAHTLHNHTNCDECQELFKEAIRVGEAYWDAYRHKMIGFRHIEGQPGKYGVIETVFDILTIRKVKGKEHLYKYRNVPGKGITPRLEFNMVPLTTVQGRMYNTLVEKLMKFMEVSDGQSTP